MAKQSGQWSICQFAMQKDSDGMDYFTLQWGFDSRDEAVRSLGRAAKEAGVSEDELVIIQTVFPHDLREDEA